MSSCQWCGSEVRFGSPRCCSGGAAKRERETQIQAARDARLADLERRIAALEQRLSTLLEVTP